MKKYSYSDILKTREIELLKSEVIISFILRKTQIIFIPVNKLPKRLNTRPAIIVLSKIVNNFSTV